MNRSGRVQVLILLVFVVLELLPTRMAAQAPKGLRSNLYAHVMKNAEVDAAFAQIQDSWDVFVKPNHGVTFRVSTEKLPWKVHTEADELWFVRRGSAKVGLAPFSLQMGVTPPGELHDVGAGDVVYVPRHLAYQIEPRAGRFEYVAVRTFVMRQPGTEGSRSAGRRVRPGVFPSVTVIPGEQIDKTFASSSSTVSLGSAGGMSISQIIYNGAIGPYESHETADQMYFVRHGTARGYFDGRIVNAKLTTSGQIRGTGVIDASEYTLGPGDIVWLPRNTTHFVDPGTNKVGYIILGFPTGEGFLPESISRGKGAL